MMKICWGVPTSDDFSRNRMNWSLKRTSAKTTVRVAIARSIKNPLQQCAQGGFKLFGFNTYTFVPSFGARGGNTCSGIAQRYCLPLVRRANSSFAASIIEGSSNASSAAPAIVFAA